MITTTPCGQCRHWTGEAPPYRPHPFLGVVRRCTNAAITPERVTSAMWSVLWPWTEARDTCPYGEPRAAGGAA
jgi:hypothetical protein